MSIQHCQFVTKSPSIFFPVFQAKKEANLEYT
jgi:hypothetical protein